MSKALILRETQLERLRQNIAPNAKRYSCDQSWLGDYFGSDPWYLPSNIEIAKDVQLRSPASKNELFDLENTKTLYSALRHLTPIQAADERIWAYLAHVTYWDYMRKRWATEQYSGNERFVDNVKERYFFMPNRSRALVRNGIARLWWYGYSTYDERRADPFELTAVLLKKLDVTQSILEREFSLNRQVTHAVLSVLLKREKDGAPFYDREKIRDLAKYLVQIGGVTIIDALSTSDMQEVVNQKVNNLSVVA